MNRKVHIVSQGEEITTAAMNPVMAEKVTDVIRQLDNATSAKLNFTSN